MSTLSEHLCSSNDKLHECAAVIVSHPKDYETLAETISSLRKHARQVGQIFVVSPSDPGVEILRQGQEPSRGDAAWVDETIFPFRLSDFEGCLPSPGWVLQQCLKLYAPSVLAGSPLLKTTPQAFVVVDADVIWLKDVDFVDEAGRALLSTFGVSDVPPRMRSASDLARFDDFVESILPGLTKRRRCAESAVVHHTVLLPKVLRDLFARIEGKSVSAGEGRNSDETAETPQHQDHCLWERFRSLAVNGRTPVSEYELYFAFAWRYHRGALVHRPLPFAVAKDWRAWANTKDAQPTKPAYVVSHSHLRLDASLDSGQLSRREGVINDPQAQIASGSLGALGEKALGEEGDVPKAGSRTQPAAQVFAVLDKQGALESFF